jgi:polyferredoxin
MERGGYLPPLFCVWRKKLTWQELKKKYGRKALLFVCGWFTIPAITGGWLYDLFGTSDFGEIKEKILNPAEWLDAFTVYTIAFLTFGFLPEKISKRHWFVRFVYFIVYYLVLLKISKLLVV